MLKSIISTIEAEGGASSQSTVEGDEKLQNMTSQSKVLFETSSHDNIPESSFSPFNSEHTASGPLLLTSTGFQNSTTKCGEAKFPVDVSRGLGRYQHVEK